MTQSNKKCYLCPICNGQACKGQMPGMGGINNSFNFISNYNDLEKIAASGKIPQEQLNKTPEISVMLAPITGAIQNCGYHTEKEFYPQLIKAAQNKNALISIGDGAPDEKFLFGLEALRSTGKKGAAFIKPFPNDKILQRIELCKNDVQIVGIDTDAYAIVTMRNMSKLQKKTTKQLIEIQDRLHQLGIKFAIKGVFTLRDLLIVKKVKPDIALVSNHGGRIKTRKGSTIKFLIKYKNFLKKYAKEIWIDGGFRTPQHYNIAEYYGASCVLVGRPFVSDVLKQLS